MWCKTTLYTDRTDFAYLVALQTLPSTSGDSSLQPMSNLSSFFRRKTQIHSFLIFATFKKCNKKNHTLHKNSTNTYCFPSFTTKCFRFWCYNNLLVLFLVATQNVCRYLSFKWTAGSDRNGGSHMSLKSYFTKHRTGLRFYLKTASARG